MKLETRLEKLEAATPQGHCPHLPPVVRYFDPDGSDVTDSEPQAQSAARSAAACDCGRERLVIETHYVKYIRGISMDDL